MVTVGSQGGPVESADHVGCILAIVGSRHFQGVYDWTRQAETIITSVLFEHRPVLVVSGGAVGIDTLAKDVAERLGYQVSEVRPTVFTWEGVGGLKDRNSRIASGCQCLVRIFDPASATYGSGWTADQATMLGKHVERYPITNFDSSTIERLKLENQMKRLASGKSNYDPNK